MNTIFRNLTLGVVMAPLAAMAYQTAETIEEAKAKAGDDGIVIATYAEGWDRHSKDTINRMLANPEVTKALGNAVVMKLGVPNISTKEVQAETEKRFGKTNLSFPDAYPAFLIYNKNAYRVADVCIRFDERKKPKAFARRLQKKMADIASQNKLLAQAETASGVQRARLLGQAAQMPGLNKPQDVAKLIQQADPDDASRMHQAVTLNPHNMAERSAKTEDWKASLDEVKTILKNPELTTLQKQQLHCIAIGLVRRNGGLAYKKELISLINQLEKLDPDSTLGQSAKDARRLWVRELTLAEGWSPDVIPSDTTPVEVAGAIPMKEAGTYKVTFAYKSGNHMVQVSAVELYDGKKKVAEDRHYGSAGIKSNNNVYTLNVPSKVANPKLFITFSMGNNRNSYGMILVDKQ